MSLAAPTKLIAIDPGACTGWALFIGSGLARVAVQPHGLLPSFVRVSPARIVVERPAIYPGGRQKARPRDIITLAVRAGESAQHALDACLHGLENDAAVEYVEPATWKGRVQKAACHAAIRRVLSPAELAGLDAQTKDLPATKLHNALDAVGIGLWAVGRGFR